MKLTFSSIVNSVSDQENRAVSEVLAACDNSSGGCDTDNCDVCQSGCQGGTDGCDGT